MTDLALRQSLRDLARCSSGDIDVFSAWLYAELRAGGEGLTRHGERAKVVIRIRNSSDKLKRRHVSVPLYGPPGKRTETEEPRTVRSFLCHAYPMSVRQFRHATCPYWTVSLGGLRDHSAWAGIPGALYLFPVLERGVYKWTAWYAEDAVISFTSPEALIEYLGPQPRWRDKQQRLFDWLITDPASPRCKCGALWKAPKKRHRGRQCDASSAINGYCKLCFEECLPLLLADGTCRRHAEALDENGACKKCEAAP